MAYNVALGMSSNLPIVVWRFPNSTDCPHIECENFFSTREIALKHFRDEHADNSMLCYVCKEIVSIQALPLHFEMNHPNHLTPKPKMVSLFVYISVIILCYEL